MRWLWVVISIASGITLFFAVLPAQAQPAGPGWWELIDWSIDTTNTSAGTTWDCSITQGNAHCWGTLASSGSSYFISQYLETNRRTHTNTKALVLYVTRINYSNYYFIMGSPTNDEILLDLDYAYPYEQNQEMLCYSWSGADAAWLAWADANCDYHYQSHFRGSMTSDSHLFHWRHQKGASGAFEVEFTAYFVYEGPPPSSGGGSSGGGLITGPVKYASWSCAFTITNTQIISAGGVTSTQTTTQSYTTPANLLNNWSFEDSDGSVPTGWGTAVNGAIQPLTALWWVNGHANYGSRSISGVDDYSAIQEMPLYSSGQYLAGFSAKCTGANCGGATARWNGAGIATSSNLSITYQAYTGTHTTGGGGAWFEIDFTYDPDVYVDDVFVVPWDSISNTVNCDPAFFPPPGDPAGGAAPPNCVLDPDTGACITVPIGGAGVTCYYCNPPNRATGTNVSYWIAWLGCVLRNMFSCSLRVWLLRLQNQVLGVYQAVLAIMLFIGPFVQGAASYTRSMGSWFVLVINQYWLALASFLENIQTIVVITDTGSSLLEEIIDLLLALAFLLIDALSALVNIVDLLVSVMVQSWRAFDAPPHQLAALIDPNYYSSNPLQFQQNIALAGGNTSKTVLYLSWGVQTIDFVAASLYLNYAQYPLLALFGIVLVFWVQKQFRGVMPK